jgi:hypothetical protein
MMEAHSLHIAEPENSFEKSMGFKALPLISHYQKVKNKG